ncbi:NAD(P)-dependent oxidoreductase [Paenibacillus sp. CAA11]|uniref:SDR family oxidoreductase n=1 Tax=Paenibacillus sp. CAA11 TaxID=1532905 RepID=UPI000D3406AC|nr:SDR family oxidoreductase [Paenibacillus sp. CAA11]AWB44908.1 NAD(P)-dependent oxidoreductase [Paenibacillus sp. CAA11]
MNVLVVGASGQIGRQLVRMLAESGKHRVTAMVRRQEQADKLLQEGIQAVNGNLLAGVEELVRLVTGFDSIVFTAGSGGSTGADMTLLIDLDGAVKMMEAAELAGVKRFVMVSAMGAHRRDRWVEQIKPYYAAKHYADRILVSTSLDYTIIRPGALLNEPGTGRIACAEDLERGAIPREDVARMIQAVLDDTRTYRRAFDLKSGDTSIEAALQQL